MTDCRSDEWIARPDAETRGASAESRSRAEGSSSAMHWRFDSSPWDFATGVTEKLDRSALASTLAERAVRCVSDRHQAGGPRRAVSLLHRRGKCAARAQHIRTHWAHPSLRPRQKRYEPWRCAHSADGRCGNGTCRSGRESIRRSGLTAASDRDLRSSGPTERRRRRR